MAGATRCRRRSPPSHRASAARRWPASAPTRRRDGRRVADRRAGGRCNWASGRPAAVPGRGPSARRRGRRCRRRRVGPRPAPVPWRCCQSGPGQMKPDAESRTSARATSSGVSMMRPAIGSSPPPTIGTCTPPATRIFGTLATSRTRIHGRYGPTRNRPPPPDPRPPCWPAAMASIAAGGRMLGSALRRRPPRMSAICWTM